MYGHGSKNCNIPTKCLYCAENHESKNCPNKLVADKISCANCKQHHHANDLNCPNRLAYISRRHKLQNNNVKQQRNIIYSNNSFDVNDMRNFPLLRSQQNNTCANTPTTALPQTNKATFANITRSNIQNTSSNTSSNNFLSIDEINNLLIELFDVLGKCVSREQQINEIIKLGTKYYYNKNFNG
jgi:hypothetical protein